MTPTELEWLGEQASKMRSIVEIGSLHDRTSFALATACPGDVYCIDPWTHDDGFKSWTQSIDDVFPNVTGIRAASPQAGEEVPDPVDMVFIDGAHDYESVMADVFYWATRAKVLLSGRHYVNAADFQAGKMPAFPDVKRAVIEVLGPVEAAPNTTIWTYWL